MPPSLEAGAGALQVWQVEADSFRDLVPKALFENAALIFNDMEFYTLSILVISFPAILQ